MGIIGGTRQKALGHHWHRKLLPMKELINSLTPNATVNEVARKAKCSHCDTKGVADFRLLYVCGAKERSEQLLNF